jgi:hypothetical protein
MAEEASQRPPYDGYGRLFKEVRRRWMEPRSHPTFALFFVGSFLIYGAVGVWLEFFKIVFGWGPEPGSVGALRAAIATYFPAVLGSCVLQLGISNSLRSLRALGMIVMPIFITLAFALVFSATLEDWAAILIGLVASAASLVCWWIVNADEHNLRDEDGPEPEATGNPDPTKPLLGGNALNDFQA